MKRLVRRWVANQCKRLGASGKCIEVGSYDVNGNLRDILSHTEHIGVDMQDGPGVDVVANGNDLPFADNEFDVAVCVETLEHDRYFWRTISELNRVTKSGGVVILTAPSINFGIHEWPYDFWRFTEDGLKSLIEDWCEGVESLYKDRTVFVAGRKC